MPFTPNLNLEVPLNGSYVNTWDIPVNANMTLLDSILGGTVNVALSNVPVTLSAAQYNNAIINFTGTLTGDVTVTLPAGGRIYTLVNNCVDNTAFKVTIACTTTTTYVCLPPSEPVKILAVNGANVAFVGLGHVGQYWDFGGSAVPNWITGSNPVPYLNCDGTAFSSATFPALRDYLGTNTLPDARGKFRASLNQGTGLLTGSSATGGLDGNTLLAQGGNQTIAKGNIPNYALTVADPGHFHTFPVQVPNWIATVAGQTGGDFNTNSITVTINQTDAAPTGITVNSGGSGNAYAPPSYIGGLTLIRAG